MTAMDRFVVCLRCRQSNPTSYTVCHHCGASLADAEVQPQAAPPHWLLRATRHAIAWGQDLWRWGRLAVCATRLYRLHHQRRRLLQSQGADLFSGSHNTPFEAQAQAAQLSIATTQTEEEYNVLHNQCRVSSLVILFGMFAALLTAFMLRPAPQPPRPLVATPTPTLPPSSRHAALTRYLLHDFSRIHAVSWCDDRLWVGGDGGLRRIDVQRAEVDQPVRLPVPCAVRSLAVTPTAVLIAGYPGVYSCPRGPGNADPAVAEAILPGVLARCLYTNGPTETWAGTLDEGILRLSDRSTWGRLATDRSPTIGIRALADGLVACHERSLWWHQGGSAKPIALPPLPAGTVFNCLLSDETDLVLGTSQGLLRGLRLSAARFAWLPVNADQPQQITSLAQCRNGLLVGAPEGLFVLARGTLAPWAVGTAISALVTDANGIAAGVPGGVDHFEFLEEATPQTSTQLRAPPPFPASAPTRLHHATATVATDSETPPATMPTVLQTAPTLVSVDDSGAVLIGLGSGTWFTWHRGEWQGPCRLGDPATAGTFLTGGSGRGPLIARIATGTLYSIAATMTRLLGSGFSPAGVRSVLVSPRGIEMLGENGDLHLVATTSVASTVWPASPLPLHLTSWENRPMVITPSGVGHWPERIATRFFPVHGEYANATVTAGIGSRQGLIVGFADGRVATFDGRRYRPRGEIAGPVRGLIETAGGRVLAWSAHDLFRDERHGFSRIVHLTTGEITGVAPISESGLIFVATTQGLKTEQLNQ